MKIVQKSIDDVIPYDRPSRRSPSPSGSSASASRSWSTPTGVIIVGHTRWKAARSSACPKVPVHVATDLTPEQIRRTASPTTRPARLADWDLDLLPIELAELQGRHRLDLLGFDEDELASCSPAGREGGPDRSRRIPEPPDDPITQPGDLWVLGDHRLLCGDSGSAEDLDRLLDGADHRPGEHRPAVQREGRAAQQQRHRRRQQLSSFQRPKTHHQKLRRRPASREVEADTKKMRAKDRPLENDFVSDEAFDEMLLAWFGNAARVLKPGGRSTSGAATPTSATTPAPLKAAGLYFSQGIVWDKQHPVLTRKDFMGAFEICFYGWKEGAGHTSTDRTTRPTSGM
jgi:hypothetical protein